RRSRRAFPTRRSSDLGGACARGRTAAAGRRCSRGRRGRSWSWGGGRPRCGGSGGGVCRALELDQVVLEDVRDRERRGVSGRDEGAVDGQVDQGRVLLRGTVREQGVVIQ